LAEAINFFPNTFALVSPDYRSLAPGCRYQGISHAVQALCRVRGGGQRIGIPMGKVSPESLIG